MSIFSDRYDYLTRKQANIIYAAIKRGDLNAPASFTRKMYDAVGDTTKETYETMRRYQILVSLIIEEELELAQNVIDGAWYDKRNVEVSRRAFTDDDIGRFDTEDDIQRKKEEGIPVYEMKWVETDAMP